MHPAIVMRGRFEMADRAGQVSGLALWSVNGGLARRSGSVVTDTDAPSVRV